MEVLTRTFEEELREKMIQAKKECKYNPTRFNQMLAQYGGVETARRLIASAQKTGNLSEGLSTLWSCGAWTYQWKNRYASRSTRHFFLKQKSCIAKTSLENWDAK